jgi:hypothetical protein
MDDKLTDVGRIQRQPSLIQLPYIKNNWRMWNISTILVA